MMKIKFIIAYFGKLPEFMPLWIKSCRYNSDVDFLLFTDDKTNYEYASNIQVIYTTLEEIKKRFEEILGFEICLDNPYKLCDFKVLYGAAFQDELVGYDFWGHCDLDQIMGSLRSFLTDDLLYAYDKIYRLGHLTLYRNIPEINYLFKKAEDCGWYSYKTVFTSAIDFAFDECGIPRIMEKNPQIRYLDAMDGADIAPYPSFLTVTPHDNKVKNSLLQAFYWNDGHVYQVYIENNEVKTRELAYIHLFRRKMSFDSTFKYENFYILKNRFEAGVLLPLSQNDIYIKNPYPGKLTYLYEKYRHKINYQFIRRIKRRIKLIWEAR